MATCPWAKNQPYCRRKTYGIWQMCVRVHHLGSTHSCPLDKWA
uniref:Uncharacterized protein n=1 Tax=Lepeophtheirus salmonis TaxID=72036 RepID=A0A0K2TE35_LEPSM